MARAMKLNPRDVNGIVGRLDMTLTNFELSHPPPAHAPAFDRLVRLRELHVLFAAEVDAMGAVKLAARGNRWAFRALGVEATAEDPLSAYRNWRARALALAQDAA